MAADTKGQICDGSTSQILHHEVCVLCIYVCGKFHAGKVHNLSSMLLYYDCILANIMLLVSYNTEDM